MHTLKSTRTHPAPYSKNNWVSGSLRRHRRLKVRELNDTLTCYLCRGYLINPTAIDNCIHSYCRSCIVQYLQSHNLCPQCKATDAKYISAVNLKSDEILRRLVFKLVPGLYYQERESMLQFSNNSKMSDLTEKDYNELEDDFFSPIEPISLSLEYHPALLTFCCKDEIPPVRYLQCPAGVMIHHLKRFLCSKYDIDPDNPLVEIEIIHEEEVLPNDFTLMDVGYCYNWKRNGPMRFTYRILIHTDMANDVSKTHDLEANTNVCFSQKPEVKQDISSAEPGPQSTGKIVRFTVDHFELNESLEDPLPPPMTYTVFKSKAQESRNLGNRTNGRTSMPETELNESLLNDGNGPVKVIIARKHAEIKKNSPKHASSTQEASYVVTSTDFKSLRSNDLRYSDYTVTSTTSMNSTSKSKQKMEKSVVADTQKNQISKCDIVVSIPQSQVSGFQKSAEDSITLAQLKTANKKTLPNSPQTFKPKNVPKLKIELSSLKTKISIPKPKSADTGLEPHHKKSKHRKYSLEENGPTSDKVDLETYVKNIGLKPIEVVTAAESLESGGKVKQSPDASPMSSCSSTTSSSNGNFVFSSSTEITSSSHKKRKKKHSRESKDSSGKRRKLHAEISSQPADESLKMKVKLMAPYAHKAHKAESRKASSKNNTLPVPAVADQTPNDVAESHDEAENNLINTNKNDTLNINISSLNQALSEESLNISNLMIGQKNTSTSDDESLELPSPTDLCQLTDTTDSMTNSKPPLPKPISNIKDTKIPSSPPLPPSLFKTTPLTLTTAASPSLSGVKTSSPLPSFVVKPAQKTVTKPMSTGQPPASHPSMAGPKTSSSLNKIQNFAVPNPPRSMPSSPKLCSLPTSIASAAHKQMGAQLKRSASLDEAYGANSQIKSNEKLMRKPSYGNVLYSAPIRLNNVAGQKDSCQQKSKSMDKPSYPPISYTLELNKRKSLTASNLPPSSINVSKMSETLSMYNNSASSQPALTITTQSKQPTAQQMVGLGPYTPLDKPALEILRITSSQVPADVQSLPPRSPPKSTRPAHPPIPLLKIKKPGQQSVSTTSPPIARSSPASALTTATKSPSAVPSTPPALINMRNTIPLSVVAKASNAKETNPKVESKSIGFISQDRPPISLRDFRPTSKDGSVEILDLSANKTHENPKQSHVQTTIGNSLEAALNKIKQNITSCTVVDSLQSGKFSVAKTNTEDLQNLQMLSESALSREKIAIKPQQKLFEMSKVQQSSVVRQQNASVRSIPNPSALAFRNQQPPLSMLASLASPLSAQTTSSSSSSTSSLALSASASSASSSTVTTSDVKTLSPPSLFVNTPKSPNTPNQASPRTKKHASIDQVAANLNMRAAAAEAEACAAKAAALEDSPTTVSSTSAAVVKKSPPPCSGAATVNSSTVGPIKSISSPNVVSSDSSAISEATANNTQTASAISTTSAEIITQQASPEQQRPTANQTPPKTSFKSIPSLVATTPSESDSVGNSV